MSMIQFSCPSCNAQYRVPAKAGGKQATCKSCGKQVTVPKSSEASGTGSGSGNVDLSGLYNSAQAGGAPTVMAPPMEGGSVFGSTKARRSGPSPALLIGIGGGVVVLLLAVVLIVVLMGGGGDSPDPNPAAGAGVAGTTPSRARVRGGSPRTETTENNNGSTDTPEDGNGNGGTGTGTTTTPPAAQGRLIDPPTAALTGVMDWSLNVPEKVAAYAETVRVRGMVLTFPPEWRAEVTTARAALNGSPELRDALVRELGNEVLETAILQAGPRESLVDVEFMMAVSRNKDNRDWPTLRSIRAITPSALGLDDVDPGDFRDGVNNADPAIAAGFGFLDAMTNRFDTANVAFNPLKPEVYYLKDGGYDRVEYGTLFGGHPFARVTLNNTAEGTKTRLYVGSVGHMQVTIAATAPTQYAELLDDMDWVVRSARLMTAAQAREYARGDSVYEMWVNDTFVDVAYAGDTAPHDGLTKPGWDGFSERSLFQRSAAASIVTPYRQPYGIIPPEGLRLATTNRVAARWVPDSNGLWMQMRVTKLEGRTQRTMSSPIMPAEGDTGERLFVHSRAIPLPAGYEHSEIEADELTLHRVLMPAEEGQSMRKVFYVLFDGADQVTIEGHYDASRPEDLERLDAAAKTLTRI